MSASHCSTIGNKWGSCPKQKEAALSGESHLFLPRNYKGSSVCTGVGLLVNSLVARLHLWLLLGSLWPHKF